MLKIGFVLIYIQNQIMGGFVNINNSKLATDMKEIGITTVIDLNSRDSDRETKTWHIKANLKHDIELDDAWNNGEFNSFAVYEHKHFYKVTFDEAIGCPTNKYKLDLNWTYDDNHFTKNTSLYFHKVEYGSVSR